MSRLDGLIAELCPDGVEFKKLNVVFEQFSGMTGVSNKWSNEGNCFFIDYMNAYNNLKIDTTAIKKATVKNLNQHILEPGDILFTSASETINECAVASEIEDSIQENIFLDDHLFGLRIKNEYKSAVAKGYLKYAFRSALFRAQVFKVVRGVTRYYISKTDFMKLSIPLPPLPIQQEIVSILDNFAELTAELAAELTARKKQYEYYRDLLLYKKKAIPLVSLKTVVKRSSSGSTPTKGVNAYYENGTVPWLRTQDVKFNEIYEIESFITEEAVKKTSAKWIPENCVIVAISGATAGRCAINKIPTTTNQHCLNMEIDNSKALYKYVYYCVYSRYEELISRKQGARGDLNSTLIMGIEIPLPPIQEQDRIVKILDQFDALVNDISIGLPAEIQARQKQYEYYRDKLLTFKEKEA